MNECMKEKPCSYTRTIEEKEQWLEAFIRAIHETSQRKSSLKLHFNPDQRIIDVDLGQKQPMLIRSDSVTKCMECGSQFTMVRRKHHCRACGAVSEMLLLFACCLVSQFYYIL